MEISGHKTLFQVSILTISRSSTDLDDNPMYPSSLHTQRVSCLLHDLKKRKRETNSQTYKPFQLSTPRFFYQPTLLTTTFEARIKPRSNGRPPTTPRHPRKNKRTTPNPQPNLDPTPHPTPPKPLRTPLRTRPKSLPARRRIPRFRPLPLHLPPRHLAPTHKNGITLLPRKLGLNHRPDKPTQLVPFQTPENSFSARLRRCNRNDSEFHRSTRRAAKRCVLRGRGIATCVL